MAATEKAAKLARKHGLKLREIKGTGKDGKVVIDFGTPVHWIGLTPQQACDIASAILKRARYVARQNGETIAFNLMP